ncbi:DSC E3 ubiquitin ligase complex subunit 1 like protein [Verticillium longisporum]|uniref:DSC E3 ubiquitin ligase complex subunit A n=2 Tax=Verticillium longisporum TaxID=100787 RepID=A0A8I2ZDR6_VERLO|nr:DSC E3 ubiquitin ligase complex subunit 1 like protein [Verticillium longisporum]
MPPRQPPQFISIFLFIVFLWILFSPESPSQYLSFGTILAERVERHKAALEHLNASSWGDFSPPQSDSPKGFAPTYVNFTGFREGDGLAWADLSRFQQQCQGWSHRINPPKAGHDGLMHGEREAAVWQNATGMLKGQWVRKDASVQRGVADYNLTTMAPEHAWPGVYSSWSRNITGHEGKMVLDMIDTGRNVREMAYELPSDIVDTAGGTVRTAKASLEVEDVHGTGSTWEVRMYGVQWPRTGTILLTTTSEKFDGIFGLPHLAMGPDYFQSSQRLLNETLANVVRKESATFFNTMSLPWSSDPVNAQQEALDPEPHCEYVLYAQVHPPDKTSLNMRGFDPDYNSMADVIRDIEQELRFPNGAPVRGIPELQMSAILWSPDCAFFLESKGPPDFASVDGQHLVGRKIEVIYGQIRFWVMAFATVFLGQVFLLKDQMEESSTPSTLCRISYASISMMVVLDGIVFGGAVIWALDAAITFVESLSLLITAFLAMAIGGTFLAEMHKVQEPLERRRAERGSPPGRGTPRPSPTPLPREESPAAPNPTPESVPTPAPESTSPTPATPLQRAPSPPIIIPSDQDIDAEIEENETATAAAANPRLQAASARSMIVARFALTISFILILSIISTSWSSRTRSLFSNALALLYVSFWVPQIHRNIMRNCRRALSWRFMIGQSILRLLPLAYFYLCEDNFLMAEPDPRAFFVFCAWLWVQLWILAAQDILGPRFGVPAGWAPEAWDYHPVLREDKLEDGSFPVGLLSSLEPVQAEQGKDGAVAGARSAKTECAICFDTLEVPVMKAAEADSTAGGVAGVLNRRNYMVTPCRHIFHSPCLESWMRYRLKCPICRDDLPPL